MILADLFDPFLFQLIIVGAIVTLINRLAGHYILTRFEPINYRVEAALEAVPVAVMTTLVVPAVVEGSWPEWLCFAMAMVLSLRVSFTIAVFGSVAVLLVIRQFV
jgi:uncharacterized membrane protein